MKYVFTFITAFLLSITFLFAQQNTTIIDQDKEKFEENVFNKEFDEQEDTSNLDQKLYDRIPEELPDWTLSPINMKSKVRVVGFSDPNMEKEEAYKQATLRAKAIYAILKLSKVSNITDDYTNLKESGKYSLYATKFQDFSLAKSIFAYNNSEVIITDTFFTKYNEGVVAIEYDYIENSPLNKDTLIVKGENLQVFIEKNFRKEKVEFFNFSIQDKLYEADSSYYIAQYNYKIVNRGYDISSIYGDHLIEFKERTYMYRSNLDFMSDSTDTDLKTFRLNRGLWNGYISGILTNVSVISKQLASQVKNSNDYYSLKNEGLIRTISRSKISLDLIEFKMIENQFYIDLDGIIVH